jgi:hypothetical protein
MTSKNTKYTKYTKKAKNDFYLAMYKKKLEVELALCMRNKCPHEHNIYTREGEYAKKHATTCLKESGGKITPYYINCFKTRYLSKREKHHAKLLQTVSSCINRECIPKLKNEIEHKKEKLEGGLCLHNKCPNEYNSYLKEKNHALQIIAMCLRESGGKETPQYSECYKNKYESKRQKHLNEKIKNMQTCMHQKCSSLNSSSNA